MRRLKHLPPAQWPAADHVAFEAAYAPGGIFDDARGPGAHLVKGTRGMIRTTLPALARLPHRMPPGRPPADTCGAHHSQASSHVH